MSPGFLGAGQIASIIGTALPTSSNFFINYAIVQVGQERCRFDERPVQGLALCKPTAYRSCCHLFLVPESLLLCAGTRHCGKSSLAVREAPVLSVHRLWNAVMLACMIVHSLLSVTVAAICIPWHGS